jgi:hypothetical protein
MDPDARWRAYVEASAAALDLTIPDERRATVVTVMKRLAGQAEHLLAFELGPESDLTEPLPE